MDIKSVKRFLCLFCVLLCAGAVLSGCVSSKNEGKEIGQDYDKEQALEDTQIAAADLDEGAEEEAPAEVNTELSGSIVYWTWDKAAPYYGERFTKKYPNTTVTVNVVPDYPQKIKQVLAAGVDVPDVMMVENAFYGQEANDPALEDLGAEPYNAMDMRDYFYAFWFDSGIGADGVLRVLPNSPGMAANFYRRDIAKDLFGTDDPDALATNIADWDMVYEAGLRLKELSGGKRFMISNAANVYSTMVSQTGRAMVEDGKINTDIFLEPLRVAKKFRDAGIEAKQADWSPEWTAGMQNGDVLMYLSGSWGESYVLIANIQDTQDGLWGVTSMPGGNVNMGGNGFSIPKAAKNKELAWEFVKFATTDLEMQADQLKRFACYPAFKEAANDPYFQLPVPLFNGQTARMKYGELAENMIFVPRTPYDQTISTVMTKYTESVFNGEMTPEDAVQKMKEEVVSQFKELS